MSSIRSSSRTGAGGGHDLRLSLKGSFAESDVYGQGCAAPVHFYGDTVTRAFHRDGLLHLPHASDFLAVDFDDHVIDTKALRFRRPALGDRCQLDARNRREAITLGGDRVDRAHPYAEPGPAYTSELDQIFRDPVRQVDGNRESVPLVVSRLAGDGGIDSDDLPPEIHHRPPRVARIDHGVGLDEVLDGEPGVDPSRLVLPEPPPKQLKGASKGADDPYSHRVIQAIAGATEPGVADGHDPLSDTEVGRAPEVEPGQIGCVDLDHRDVREWIPSHDLGLEGAPILEKNGEKVRPVDDVVVGKDVTILGDDESASPGDPIRPVLRILVRHAQARRLRTGGPLSCFASWLRSARPPE